MLGMYTRTRASPPRLDLRRFRARQVQREGNVVFAAHCWWEGIGVGNAGREWSRPRRRNETSPSSLCRPITGQAPRYAFMQNHGTHGIISGAQISIGCFSVDPQDSDLVAQPPFLISPRSMYNSSYFSKMYLCATVAHGCSTGCAKMSNRRAVQPAYLALIK